MEVMGGKITINLKELN